MLTIFPRRADQGNAARQCFKNPDSRDSQELAGVVQTWHVYRRPSRGQYFRHFEIGQPPPIGDSCRPQFIQSTGRIANAVNASAQAKHSNGCQKKFTQFCAALFVTPVADPRDINAWCNLREWTKNPRIGRLVPNPCAARQSISPVNSGEGGPE